MSAIPPPLEGRWQLVCAEQAGEPAPDEFAQSTTLELADQAYRVRFAGQVVDQGTFEVGGAAGVRTILLRGTTGPNAGRTIPGVFQLRGDRLRICFGLDGVAPTEFITESGDQRYLATYRRLGDL